MIKFLKILKLSQRGEIATVLTFLSLGLMITGILTGAVINQTGTRTLSKAAGCTSGEWECTRDGVTHCTDQNTRDIFTGTWCNPELRWKWEDAGNSDKCGGSPAKLIPTDGNCADVTPTSVPGGNCPSGQWTCTVGNYTRCSDDTAKAEFEANWCKPEERWKYETAKNLGGNGSECKGQVSKPKPDCSDATPTPVASGTCPTFQWNCTFDGKTYCSDDAAKTLFLNTWCDGKNRWLWESAGNSNKCGGNADIPINSPDCKRNPSANTSPTPGGSPSPVPSPLPNPTKASNPGGFHLTSDIYASREGDGIKFNVHILFNSDGCDGDIKLYRDGSLVAGPNGWNIKMGPFDYNQEWAGSFTVKKGESISPGYEGTVDRCPKSTVTLRDNISCTMAVDSSGNPGVTGSGCTFKSQSAFPAYNPASPTLGVPSGPGGKYRCQDLTDSPNKDCNDTMAGPCEYGTYKYKCMSSTCPSNKSVGVGIPFWCDGDKWYDVNKLGECIGVCTPGGSPTPTPSSECQGKADGFVISSCIQQECEVPNKKWINLEKVCQGGIAYTKPGKLTGDTCNPQADKFRACAVSPGPTLTLTPIPLPTLNLNKKIAFRYHVQNVDCAWLGQCRHEMKDSDVKLETSGSAPLQNTLAREAYAGPGVGFVVFSKDIDLEVPKTYKATVRVKYTDKNYPGKLCTHVETNIPTKDISSSTTEWNVNGGLDPATDCGGSAPVVGQQIAFRYHVQNVDCAWFGQCRHEMKDSAVWLTTGNNTRKEDLIREAYAGPNVGFVVFSKNIVGLEVPKNYTAKIRVRYTDKNYSGKMCVHVETNIPTKDISSSTTEWNVNGGLDPATDCDPTRIIPDGFLLQGSSNQAFLAAIENYTKGNMGAKEMSTFISQLSRTPGTQVQLVPCDYTQPQCGFNI